LTDPLKPTIPHATLRQAMLDTVQLLTRYTDEIGASDPSLLKSVLFSSSFSSYIACLSPRSHGSRTRLSRPTSSPRTNSFCVSDGSSVVATRYITSATEEAASLFFSTGSTFEEYAPGSFKMNKADKRERIILIAYVHGALSSPRRRVNWFPWCGHLLTLSDNVPMYRSEPLTFERADWVEIPSQSCIVITPRVRAALSWSFFALI
jgi:glutamine amidotransferase